MSIPILKKYLLPVLLLNLLSGGTSSQTSGNHPQTNEPEPRSMATLVYHDKLEKVLLLDGFIREPLTEQTSIWGWDGKRWELITDKGPMARTFGGVAYDSHRDKVVLYGGRSWPTEKMMVNEDTWEWDGQQWKQFNDESLGAKNRHHLSMTYDKARNSTILIGGIGLNQDESDWIWPTDTWSWNGKDWKQKDTSGLPSRISTMAYDSKRNQIVLFGGSTPEGQLEPFYNDTWIWNGKRWKKITVKDGPSARNAHAMAYDSGNGVMLLYGGWRKNGSEKLSDMWKWDGTQWTEIKLTGKTPGKRGGLSMAYDPKRKKTMLFGGENEKKEKLNDTWEWNGTKWSEISK